jgi:hypothetical protein
MCFGLSRRDKKISHVQTKIRKGVPIYKICENSTPLARFNGRLGLTAH